MIGTSTGPATEHQDERFERMKEIGCIVSRMRGMGWVPCEIHHLVSGNKRRGHDETVGLNPWLHRGQPFNGLTAQQCRDMFGASLADGSKPFHREHGSDDELLEIQNAMLIASGFDPTPRGNNAKRKAPSMKGKCPPMRSAPFPKRVKPPKVKKPRTNLSSSKIVPRPEAK